MSKSHKQLCDEIEEQQFRVLGVVHAMPDEHSLTLKEVVVELDRLRRRAADLETANALRAGLIAKLQPRTEPAGPRPVGPPDHVSNW